MHDVLLRAAAWFERHDRIDDAIRHLLRADEAAAAATPAAVRGGLVLRARRRRRLPDARRTAAHVPRSGRSWRSCWPTPPPPAGTSTGFHHWLDICDARITPDTVVRDWRNPRAAALMIRALIGLPDTDTARAVELCQQAVALESDGPGRPIALMSLGNALARDGRFAEAADLLVDAWRQRHRAPWSPGVTLQIAGNLGLSLLELGRTADLDAFLREAGPLADEADREWGGAAGPVTAMLRLVQGRNHYQQGDAVLARATLTRAATLAELAALPTSLVLALVFLADAELGMR